LVDSCALASLELTPLVEGDGVFLDFVTWTPKPEGKKNADYNKSPPILITGIR